MKTKNFLTRCFNILIDSITLFVTSNFTQSSLLQGEVKITPLTSRSREARVQNNIKQKAFSIVEIVIVITIIILLAIIGASVATSRSDKTKNTKVLADIETVKTAILAYNTTEEGGLILPE
ncbi:MAG: hypothetical protein LBD88_05480 [Candidatus Peribacteria bacterium]|jgi:hypothetical protein|nr:hypothetical protein [Candidatus Peribacteria bacterium]